MKGKFKVYAEINKKEDLIYIGETKLKTTFITTEENSKQKISGYSPSINFTEETKVDEVRSMLANDREVMLYFLPIDEEDISVEKALVSLDNYSPKGVFIFSQIGKRKLHETEIEEIKDILPN